MTIYWQYISGTERCSLSETGFATYSLENGVWRDYPRRLTEKFNYNMIINMMDNDKNWQRSRALS